MSRSWVRALGVMVCLLPLAAPAAAADAEAGAGNDQTLLLVIVPLLLLQLVLLAWGLYDLTRPGRRVKGDSKGLWALVIILINVIGPLVYFLWGREET